MMQYAKFALGVIVVLAVVNRIPQVSDLVYSK